MTEVLHYVEITMADDAVILGWVEHRELISISMGTFPMLDLVDTQRRLVRVVHMKYVQCIEIRDPEGKP